MLFFLAEALVKAQPLLCTALAFALAWNAGVVNIGAEGQFYMGALFSTIIALLFGKNEGIPFPLPLALIAGCVGGAAWGLLAGILKIRFGASEVITTIMLNYIALWIVSLLVSGPLIATAGGYPVSPPIPHTVILPRIPFLGRLHAGIFIVFLAVLFYTILMQKTTLGYQIRALGLCSGAALYAGMNTNGLALLSLGLSGAFAGLGGALEVLGVQHRLLASLSPGYGYDGIAIALLGQCKGWGLSIVALFLGALRTAAAQMEMSYHIPIAMVFIVEGSLVLALACMDARKARKKHG